MSTERRSPGRPPIALDRIVTAALEIVDEDGADALSMRSLAQRLNSGTATLYRHFTGRAELVAAVVDRVFGNVEIDVERLSALPWQDACKAGARSMFEGLRRHHNVTPLLADGVPTGPNALASRERMLAFLLANNFPPALAAKSYATLARYVLGFAMQLGTDPPDDAAASATFRHLDPGRFPSTVALADHLPVPWEDEFTFGLDLIVDGLAQALRHNVTRGG